MTEPAIEGDERGGLRAYRLGGRLGTLYSDPVSDFRGSPETEESEEPGTDLDGLWFLLRTWLLLRTWRTRSWLRFSSTFLCTTPALLASSDCFINELTRWVGFGGLKGFVETGTDLAYATGGGTDCRVGGLRGGKGGPFEGCSP